MSLDHKSLCNQHESQCGQSGRKEGQDSHLVSPSPFYLFRLQIGYSFVLLVFGAFSIYQHLFLPIFFRPRDALTKTSTYFTCCVLTDAAAAVIPLSSYLSHSLVFCSCCPDHTWERGERDCGKEDTSNMQVYAGEGCMEDVVSEKEKKSQIPTITPSRNNCHDGRFDF